MARLKEGLSDKQINYAEWLAQAPWARSPGTQQEKAKRMGISARTLMAWQKKPEIIQLVNSLYAGKLTSIVSPAVALLEKAIREPGHVSRVAFDAAKYVVQDWAKRNEIQGDIVKNIVEFYKKYKDGDIVEDS